jgi:hypothetical protein
MAIGFPTKANWAAGDVLTASAMDDLAGTVNLLQNAYQDAAPYVSGKNFLINGGFDIWQRGTSGFSTGGNYTADRWQDSQSTNITGSQGTANPPDGSRYYFVETATSTGGYYTLSQYIETANTSQLWGKSVSLSVKLKRNSTFDAVLVMEILKTSTVDGGVGATWTSLGTTAILASSISTSTWTPFSLLNIAIPNDGTANTIQVKFWYNTNPSNGSVLNIGQFQLEQGAMVTPFSRAAGTLQGELAACQRYYETGNANLFSASSTNGYTIYSPIGFRVTKRAAPTVTLTYVSSAGGFASSAASAYDIGVDSFSVGKGWNATATTPAYNYNTYTAAIEL